MTAADPDDDPPTNPSLLRLTLKLLELLVAAAINLPFVPLYLLGNVLYGRPPIVPRPSQVARYIRLCFTVHPPSPHLSPRARLYIALCILIKLVTVPFFGLAWLLDELLYGSQLDSDEVRIVDPIFMISAGRSGSTQMSRYIESDPNVEAPSILQCLFPFLWLWRLVPRTFGRFVTADHVRLFIQKMLPPEAVERHELDPFKSDTFDAVFWGCHCNSRALSLGPDVAVVDMNMAKSNPADFPWIEEGFVQLVDRLGRKHLLLRRMERAGAGTRDLKEENEMHTRPRFFLKGHFLWAASILERCYPDASFVTVVREPTSRLQSGINFMRAQPADPGLGKPTWACLSSWSRRSEVEYCNTEMEWYSRRGSIGGKDVPAAARCVVAFEDFTSDLETSMRKVYEECRLWKHGDGDVLPPHVLRTHPERRRSGYALDKSLEELGIDKEEVRSDLADYIDWCKSHAFSAKKD